MAGTDTTTSAIQWFMLYMLHYPDVQRKIFNEISDVVGLERAPNMHNKTKMNFTNAVILETQLSLLSTSKDKGCTIPADAMVLVFFDTLHLSPDLWEDPKVFKPERFFEAQGRLTQPDHIMPFGIGWRMCPSESMAKMDLFLFVAATIQRFELQPAVPGVLSSLKPAAISDPICGLKEPLDKLF